MGIEEASMMQQKVFEVNGYSFREEQKPTMEGDELSIHVAGENPRRFAMEVSAEGVILAKIISSGITLRNGDVSINVDGENLQKSHGTKDEEKAEIDDKREKGMYWQQNEGESLTEVDFGKYGTLSIEPGEHGVFARSSGQVIRGALGSQVEIKNKGKIVATTTSAMSIVPIAGTVEVVTPGEKGTSKLIIEN